MYCEKYSPWWPFPMLNRLWGWHFQRKNLPFDIDASKHSFTTTLLIYSLNSKVTFSHKNNRVAHYTLKLGLKFTKRLLLSVV